MLDREVGDRPANICACAEWKDDKRVGTRAPCLREYRLEGG